jgi:flagellin
MSFSVNTNTNALAALESLSFTQQALTKAQSEVSTGLKVAGAQDDASTFAIAQGQRGDIAGFQSISNSLALGSATINVALQGAQTISNTLNEINAKVVSAQDPTQDHNAIQNDINAFIQQINAVAAAAQFNGVNLIGQTSTNDTVLSSLNRNGTTVTAATITVNAQHLDAASLNITGINVVNQAAQITLGTQNVSDHDTLSLTVGGNTTTFEFLTSTTGESLTTASNVAVVIGASLGSTIAALNTALSKNGFNAAFASNGDVDVTSGAGDITAVTSPATAGSLTLATVGAGSTAGTAIATVQTAINAVKTALSSLGTASNQLTTQANFVKTLTDALIGGVGQLVDADLAAESAQLQALQTKQQLGIQALSIANQGPAAVLSLFR